MSRVNDLHHNVEQAVALKAAAIAANGTTNGEIIDTQGYEGLEFFLQSKTITDGAYAVTMEEGDDSALADAAAVSAEETLGDADFALADDDTAKRIGYIGKKRYVRLKIVASAVTTGVDIMSAIAALFAPAHKPVAD